MVTTNLIAISIVLILAILYLALVHFQEFYGGKQAEFPFFARHCRWCGEIVTAANTHHHGKHCSRRRRWKE